MSANGRMERKVSTKSNAGYAVKTRNLRAQILKYLHSRHVLIFGCVLVVLECMCIMAELMVDLQGIRIRFENEELEVKKFVDFMKTQKPDAFSEFEGNTLEEILITLKEVSVLWTPKEISENSCDCICATCENITISKLRKRRDSEHSARKSEYMQTTKTLNKEASHTSNKNLLKGLSGFDQISFINTLREKHSPFHSQRKMTSAKDSLVNSGVGAYSSHAKVNFQEDELNKDNLQEKLKAAINNFSFNSGHSFRSRRATLAKADSHMDDMQNVFVFTVNLDQENFYLVSKLKELSDTKISMAHLENEITKTLYYEQYQRIHDISLGIKYAGFGILTLMLAETLLKFVCTGLGFFKKKFEVFDAFIVISSFILDVIFLDSRWYETGKDATTILVLLLPWRVVRIVNNFLMTINHKHYIEIMTVKKAKKRGDIKLKKMQGLLVEIRRDIDLLINLCKTKGATDNEISACIYGKGRRTTLAAITSFASLMFISTLGKDPSTGHVFDDVYGELIQDILDDETATDKGNSEDTIMEKDEFDIESNGEADTSTISSKRNSSKKSSKKDWSKNRRRATIPRRHCSRSTENEDVFYINDGYVTSDEGKNRSYSMYNKSDVRSLPVITRPSSNYVTFEVTTQVTYL